MKVINITLDNPDLINQAAHLLVIGFRQTAPDAWPDMPSALQEVNELLQEEANILRIALNEAGTAVGWIGGLPEYDYGWELHPLVVHPDYQGQGIGRLLVQDLEKLVSGRGALTLYLGTDDVANMTSLSQADLFQNPFDHIANIQNHSRHPYEFYQKLGFTIVGILPDVNGRGKPDIWMAKRITSPTL